MDNIAFKLALELCPFFVTFSKSAPLDLDSVNYDTDFCYYYFSPLLEKRCQLKRASMCDGVTNAKRDFPDYLAYFEDDIKVLKEYNMGKVLAFCEPWSPPGVSTHLYTRKTSFTAADHSSSYMIGCFDIIDDITLGITTFKIIPHSLMMDILPPMGKIAIPVQWFAEAFHFLPNALAIVSINDPMTVQASNLQWDRILSLVHVETGLTVPSASFIVHFHGSFLGKGSYNSHDPATLSTSAAWLTGIYQGYDLGVYGIPSIGDDDGQVVCAVYMLRPTMMLAATKPSWQAKLQN